MRPIRDSFCCSSRSFTVYMHVNPHFSPLLTVLHLSFYRHLSLISTGLHHGCLSLPLLCFPLFSYSTSPSLCLLYTFHSSLLPLDSSDIHHSVSTSFFASSLCFRRSRALRHSYCAYTAHSPAAAPLHTERALLGFLHQLHPLNGILL